MDKNAYPVITNLAFRLDLPDEKQQAAATAEYRSGGKEALYAYAKARKVLPFVAVLALQLGLDTAFWQPVAELYRRRNENVIKVLDTVFRALKENGVEKCFLSQNFAALLASGRDIALFASGDVDMCGVYAEKTAIEKTFEALGFTREDRYCGKRLISSEFFHETLLPDRFGIGVEYVTISRMKLPEPIRAERFVDWSGLWQYADTAIVLPPINALSYICLVHISLHSFSRAPDIRLYVDIENCLQAGPDLEKVLAFAKADETVVRVLTALWLTQKLFAVELPGCVQEAAAAYQKRIDKLTKLVYDEEKNTLKYEPSRVNTLKIELGYYDAGNGIGQMLLPDRQWLAETYGTGAAARLKHWARILR